MKRIIWSVIMVTLTCVASATAPEEGHAIPAVTLHECEPVDCTTWAMDCSIACARCEDVPGSIKGVCAWP